MAFGSKAVYLTPAATSGINKGMNGASAPVLEERVVGRAAEICGLKSGFESPRVPALKAYC